MNAVPSRRPPHAPTPRRREGAANERHLRVAPDLRRRRRRARLAVATAVVVTVASLFTLVAFHVVAVQHAFELDALTEQRRSEERRYERLRFEVARRSSPAAVIAAASEQGLVPAVDVDYVDAPLAAPTRGDDAGTRTQQTLAETFDEAKRSLGP
jgi:hypothetical protein